ncbi:MAG: hypothetical protein MUO68_06225 [Desulfobacteraceae bacterium]|nr:hypothetical protein [Desulfobacteraceae bacterium]
MTTAHNEKMENRTAILFPHSYLPGFTRDRILSSFGSITVCQPWYMESAAGTESNDDRITIVHPPENLKPPEDPRKLLSEYRLWMSQNQGYTPLPAVGGEDTTWEIRHALRQTGKEVREPVEEQGLKWHLVLHLERELEENRTSADEMLLRVKAERSPLAEALEEANPSHGLFDDLPLSNPHLSIGERHLSPVLDAWFGLFGHSLPDGGSLLTIAPDVLTYAAELFGTGLSEPSREEDASSFPTIHLPRSSIDSRMEKDSVLARLSGRTLILVDRG